MVTFGALIDLGSCLPWFIELAVYGGDTTKMPNLTWVRMFSLFRVLKSESLFHNFEAVYRVFYFNSGILTMAFFVCGVMLLFTSTIVYYLGPREILDDADYSSIPETMYLCVLMLTGEWAPSTPQLSWYAKLAQGLTAMFSVGLFAIPASMLTWGFEAEAERLADKARKRRKAQKDGELQAEDS